jgi:uncharacterized protein (TIGR02246 family)
MHRMPAGVPLVLALLVAPFLPRPLPAETAAGAAAEIRALIAEQVAAWNRGDLEAFTAAYDDDALFVSPSGITRGRDEVLARYRKRYPDRRAMGHLTIDVEELRLNEAGGGCESRGARVLGRWTLLREGETAGTAPTGPTLIVFERRDGRWRIVEDASMEFAKPATLQGAVGSRRPPAAIVRATALATRITE